MSWHIHHLGLPEVWTTTRGRGVHVAVLDSGAARVPGIDDGRIARYDDHGNLISARDPEGHGTKVVGALASDSPDAMGVAPEARVSVFDIYDGTGSPVGQRAGRALIAAIEKGADIVCASFTMPELPTELREGLARARSRGVLVFASAGNNRGVLSPFPEDVSAPPRPPYRGDVISVAASDERGWIWPGRIGGWTSISAPGLRIRVHGLGGGVELFNGTSAAAPIAAGIAAVGLARARVRGPAYEAWLRDNLARLMYETGRTIPTPRMIQPVALLRAIDQRGPHQ